jgi:hypothetical protein
MSGPAKEARVLMAINALQSNKKLSVYRAARIYDVPTTTLCNRIAGTTPMTERESKNRLLNKLEEEVLVQHVVDLDNWGFSPRLKDIEDIANNILASHHRPSIGKL